MPRRTKYEPMEPIRLYQRKIGENLKNFRISTAITQRKLGYLLGVTYQQIQKYEKGKSNMSASYLYALAKFMKVPLIRFFEGLEGLDLEREGNNGIH